MLDNKNSLIESFDKEDFEKEMSEIRREKALSYALELKRAENITDYQFSLQNLLTSAKAIEKYLKDGE